LYPRAEYSDGNLQTVRIERVSMYVNGTRQVDGAYGCRVCLGVVRRVYVAV
jgi:hypothetical protein